MADYTANHLPGEVVTYNASATITGGQVVHLTATGRTVTVTTAASDHVVGVACHDAIAGQPIVVSRGGEQRLTAAGSITAGALVKSAAAGAVAAWVSGTDNPALVLGVALDTAADAATVHVAWRA